MLVAAAGSNATMIRGGLLGVAARADLEVDVGLGHAEIGEERRRLMRCVVVLTGVDQELAERVRRAVHAPDDRRHLHEVRTRADDIDYFQHVLDGTSHG